MGPTLIVEVGSIFSFIFFEVGVFSINLECFFHEFSPIKFWNAVAVSASPVCALPLPCDVLRLRGGVRCYSFSDMRQPAALSLLGTLIRCYVT